MSHSVANAQRVDHFTKELNPANISEIIDLIPAIYMVESHEIPDFLYFFDNFGSQNQSCLRGDHQTAIKVHENRSWG